ncbi:hypothetical protein [Pseudopedobacter saltans]
MRTGDSKKSLKFMKQ